jgi:hypothetical protein
MIHEANTVTYDLANDNLIEEEIKKIATGKLISK